MQRLQLISMDPPRHDRLKALVIKEFNPEKIAEHEESINRSSTMFSTVSPAASDSTSLTTSRGPSRLG